METVDEVGGAPVARKTTYAPMPRVGVAGGQRGDGGSASEANAPPVLVPNAEAVGSRQLYRWIAPWISGTLLVLAALLGLFTAAAAQSAGDAAAGYIAFALALAALARGIKTYFDGAGTGIWSPFLAAGSETLLLLVVLQSGLAVGGLFLAARAGDALWQYVGYALFLVSVIVIGSNLKHYFDACDNTQQRVDH